MSREAPGCDCYREHERWKDERANEQVGVLIQCRVQRADDLTDAGR